MFERDERVEGTIWWRCKFVEKRGEVGKKEEEMTKFDGGDKTSDRSLIYGSDDIIIIQVVRYSAK